MTVKLRIESDEAIVDVLPALGGSVARFDAKRGEERLPVFRPWAGESDNPRTVACFPMVPWWARISGGGITLDREFFPIALNDPEDTHPLHGDGWWSPWEIVTHSARHLALTLHSRAIPPFDYQASLDYELDGPALTIRLAIRNTAERALPFSMGLHPYFVRTADVTLEAKADGTWLEQPPQLPAKAAPDPLPARWDFNTARRLPPDFIDNSFSGWDGRGRVVWPEERYAVSVEADPGIRQYHVYSLGADCPIFCFEPVSAVIDAINLPGSAEETRLRVLKPGEETAMWARYTAELL